MSVKVIEPSAELWDIGSLEDGIAALRRIERCARISHASEDKQTEGSWERFLTAVVLQHGDWSVVEHVSASVLFTVDRGITHELVRHRLCALTQSSTRFINLGKPGCEPEFIEPEGMSRDARKEWKQSMRRSAGGYMRMLAHGCAPQIARSVLPNALAARLVVTCNLRNWRHLFLMRTSKESHPQMRQVMIPLLHTFKERIPLLYDDIVPERRQAENLRLAR